MIDWGWLDVNRFYSIIEGLHDRFVLESVSWREDILRSCSYTYSDEWEELKKKIHDNLSEQALIRKRISDIDKDLQKESTPKPKSEWTFDDELNSMVGKRPYTYTDKGKKLFSERESLSDKRRDLDHEYSLLNDKLFDIKSSIRDKEVYYNKLPIIKKASKTSYDGFKSHTGIPYYDDIIDKGLGFIAEMSPLEYLRRCAYQIFQNGTIESTLSAIKDSSVSKYASKMKSGEKFDMPYLNFKKGEQEGRHRAVAAMVAGIKVIPVLIVR